MRAPIIWSAIGKILQNDTYKEEFAQQIKVMGPMTENLSENEQLAEAISNEFVKGYEPECGLDQEIFREQYCIYIEKLNRDSPQSLADLPTTSNDDRDFGETEGFDDDFEIADSVDHDAL